MRALYALFEHPPLEIAFGVSALLAASFLAAGFVLVLGFRLAGLPISAAAGVLTGSSIRIGRLPVTREVSPQVLERLQAIEGDNHAGSLSSLGKQVSAADVEQAKQSPEVSTVAPSKTQEPTEL